MWDCKGPSISFVNLSKANRSVCVKGGFIVRRKLGLLLLAVLVVGLAGFAQTAATVRVLEGGVILLDNAGPAAAKLSITFDAAVVLTMADITVFGGGEATLVSTSNTFVFIDVVVDAGGTVQIILPADAAGANVAASTFFE